MKILLFLPIIFVLFACSHSRVNPSEKKLSSGFEYVSHKDKVFLSGQPSDTDLQAFKNEEKVTVVLNIRGAKEMKQAKLSQAKAAKDLGLTYYNIAFSERGTPNPKNIAEIEKIFMKHHKKGEKVLVHCGSGQRAAAWFGTHFRISHKSSPDKALSVAEKYGLKKHALKKKLKAYLDSVSL